MTLFRGSVTVGVTLTLRQRDTVRECPLTLNLNRLSRKLDREGWGRVGAPAPAFGDAALSAFELDLCEPGRRRLQPIGQAWRTPFETVEPARDLRLFLITG